MPMNVEIKVDAPGALPTIASVEAGLGKVETQANKTGDALNKGLGAGAPAADKTKQSTESLTEQMAKMAAAGSAFTGIAEQFKREGDMLDKIHGPAKRYADDLQALDGLLMRGAITTGEYAEQVTKMNAAIGEGPAKLEEATSGADKLGEAFEAMKIPAVGAGILELGHKLADLAAEAEHAQDEYTLLTNRALKFEDASHSQDQIIADMGTLAESLHTTREKAFELYDTVRDGTDGMRISYADQAKMAKEFGLANELAGNSVDGAAESLKRFMFDVASGTADIRAIRQQMIAVPELADLWTSAFHTSRTGLQQMLDSGKVGIRDLALALVKPSDALEEMNKKATKITATNEQMMKKWAEDVNIDVQHGMSGLQAIQNRTLGEDSTYTQVQRRGFSGLGDYDEADIARGRAAIQKFNDDAQHLTGSFGAMGEAFDKGMGKVLTGMTEAPELLAKTETAIGTIISKLDEMGMHGADAWSQVDTAFGLGVKDSQEYSQKVGNAKKQLEALRLEIAAHAIGADDARKKYEALETTINDGRLPATIKIFDSFHEPIRVHNEDLAATVALYKSASINAVQYQYELLQLRNTDPGFAELKALLDDDVKKYDEAAAAAKRYADAAKLGFDSPANHGMNVGITGHQLNADALSDAKIFKDGDKAQADKETEQDKERLRVLQSLESPLMKYRDEIAQLNKDYRDGTLDAETYTKAVQKLTKEQYNAFEAKSTDAISGLDRGLKEITNTTMNLGATITQSVTGAFSKMNESIITMVTTGKADFGQLADFIEQALAKIALQEIEIGIISAFTGGAGGAVAKVAGSWAGSDTLIHAANGYSGKVGGVGGVDTKLFAAMVSPGEHVKIQTPQQVADDQRAANGNQGVTIVNKHDTRGELAAAMSDGSMDTHVVNIMKRNAGAVQSLIRK